VSHANIAKALEALGNANEARADYRAAMTLLQALVAEDAGNPEWNDELASLRRAVR
jgi:hypothetical protein